LKKVKDLLKKKKWVETKEIEYKMITGEKWGWLHS